jgi:hypothetical protein
MGNLKIVKWRLDWIVLVLDEIVGRINYIENDYTDFFKRCIIYSNKFYWGKISNTYLENYTSLP